MNEYKAMDDDGKLNEEQASAFIVSTCQLVPNSFSSVLEHMHNLVGSTDPAPKIYSIMCGSFAEFYIRPLNPCISDIDFLISNTNTLAFSGDVQLLPSDISGLADNIIVLYQIEPYHRYPSFVRLRALGAISYNWKDKEYECEHIHIDSSNRYKVCWNLNTPTNVSVGRSIRTRFQVRTHINGPARVRPQTYRDTFGRDCVESVWCPQWPREARNWPLRHRHYGWPTTATISKILQNGCHAVYAQHRSCRDDKTQWRLSFSIAEIILLQSWTQIQQIIYHLLRFLAKKELIVKDCPKEDEVLCTYHLKTLMLWTCEEKSPEWWTSSSVIGICCELLNKLLKWLSRRRCPNYFIPEANLFYKPRNQTRSEKLAAKLRKFCKSSILSEWFVENYIQLFTRTNVKVKNHSNRREVTVHFVEYLPCLFESRKTRASESLNMMLSARFTISHHDCRIAFKYGFCSGLRQTFDCGSFLKGYDAKTCIGMACLQTIENVLCFAYYDNLLYILHAACGIGLGEISWDSSLFVELVKVISMQPKIIKSKYHNFPKTSTEQSSPSRFNFMRAHDMLKNLTGANSRPEYQLLSLMSKGFLGKALEYCDDSESYGIRPAALTYLAALHFATSEYQQAKRIFLAVLLDRTPQQKMETLNAGCLLFIDDVARIIGLCVLQKKISDNNYYINGRLYLDLRLSPTVFVCYLAAKRLLKHSYYVQPDLTLYSFPMDEYFKIFMKSRCTDPMMPCSHFSADKEIVYQRTDSWTETESTITVNPSIAKETVIHTLLEFALENMTSFYRVFHKDFGIQCDTVDCYRASFLYNNRQYDRVLLLCERILLAPDLEKDSLKLAFKNVLLLPPLDSYFDRDVQSLLGFHTLCYHLSPLNDELRKLKFKDDSTFTHWFALQVYNAEMQLSLSISRRNSFINCYYFLGRHFLARYLKVRCCVDCNRPHFEALTEFAAQKSVYPFEQIIRKYLLQKLSRHNLL